MKIYWSDCFEALAYELFSGAIERHDPFATECTVVGSPVMAGWLKQYFLYDYPKARKKQKVLAGWDFKMLHPFVNDWLAKACSGTPVGQRDAEQHPYSHGVLQWRIWNELCRKGSYPALEVYVGDNQKAADRKRWELAARLAKLFDDYQNYRADLLVKWEAGDNAGLGDEHAWQADIWRSLVKHDPGTYVKQFQSIDAKLHAGGISETYRRITVFQASSMPLAYLQFFRELGTFMDVRMFVFNPSREFWIEDPTVRRYIDELKGNADELKWFDPPHPILSGFGRGTQAFLATVLDASGGQTHDACWGDDRNATVLQRVQADIRAKNTGGLQGASDDGSIQFHVCHGPLREVEVARDLIFKWFEERSDSQPRDVQVLAPDMEAYAPFIESVFRVKESQPPIPCAISKRPAVSAGAVGAAFVRLMKLHQSRMTAPEVLEILELDPVRERYELAAGDLSEIRSLVNSAGIRWGRDGAHIAGALDVGQAGMPDTVTWRRGLDRLLAGFAAGRGDDGDDLIQAGCLGALSVCDTVEGNTAELVGKLARYFEDLCETSDDVTSSSSRKVSEWAHVYYGILERFFRGTESSFSELADIRRGIGAVARAAAVAGDPETDADAMTASIETHLNGMDPAGACDTNAVLFTPMRTMQVTPRKLLIALGMNENCFPRADQRPAFDLLSRKPRYGDRSLRYEDRLSFLETIMSARERLIFTYTGRNISDNKPVPPSPAVTEFRQYLDRVSAEKDHGGSDKSLVKPLVHKLHGFNPVYFRQKADKKGPEDWRMFFSFSRSNYEAARVLADREAQGIKTVCGNEIRFPRGYSDTVPALAAKDIALETLQEFFVNPARMFFNRALRIRLPDPARDVVTDSEIFDENALDVYKVSDEMLKDILGKSRSRLETDFEAGLNYFERLQEKTLIPPGAFGLGRARQRLADLKMFLNSALEHGSHPNLYQALLDLCESAKNPKPVSVECGAYRVHGSLPVMTCPKDAAEGRTFLLRFRYAAVKPNDRVRAWLSHVVGHAAGLSFYTDIAGRVNDGKIIKPAIETIAPVAKDAAAGILAKMLDVYEAGGRQCLPFAPACSCKYAETLAESDVAETAVAMDAASTIWSAGDYAEQNDAYLFAAWGDPGPMQHPDFAPMAVDFWGKYFPLSESGRSTLTVSAAEVDDA